MKEKQKMSRYGKKLRLRWSNRRSSRFGWLAVISKTSVSKVLHQTSFVEQSVYFQLVGSLITAAIGKINYGADGEIKTTHFW